MTIRRGPVFSWSRSGLNWDTPPWESDSPNLVALEQYLRTEFGGGNMGIHYDRNRPGGSPSEHSWGAALDHGTEQKMVDWMNGRGIPTGPALSRADHFAMVDWVAAHSEELHIQSIVDIGRSWQSDRVDNGALGWIPYNSKYTGHAHFVTTYDGWGDATPVADRIQSDRSPRRVDLLDISAYQTITKWADVPVVPIVHRAVTNKNETDTRFGSRMPVISTRTELFGGYVVLAPGRIVEQMARYVDLMRPFWRDGAFTQLDVEPWDGIGLITAGELDQAIALHNAAFGVGRCFVYMNPTVTRPLWDEFKQRHPQVPTWVPGYRADDNIKAKRHDATIHQWTDQHRPSGFTGNVDANEIRNIPAVQRAAGLIPQEEDFDMPEYFKLTKLNQPGPLYERVGSLVRYIDADVWVALGQPAPTVRRSRDECRHLHMVNVPPREDRGIWSNA